MSLVTLVVDDVARSRAFYVDGLGWTAEFDGGDEVLMFRLGEHLLLSLWNREHAAREIGEVAAGVTAPVTLAHNVATTEEVDRILALARDAGSPLVSEAVARGWGGYSGYFSDPDGFRWEIAVNPTPLGNSLLP
ncbi:VOC family protein [Brevibacterium samyangense]|uniref:VOC family protein n=1 Tax=Brevibacterium samyangense TaxID=366888 RepID=A0ABN2T4P0_9MICO